MLILLLNYNFKFLLKVNAANNYTLAAFIVKF